MDNKTPQYQRAVTPTIDSSLSPSLVKGKVLSYNANLIRNARPNIPAGDKLYGSMATGVGGASASSRSAPLSPRSTTGSIAEMNSQGKNGGSSGKSTYNSYGQKQGATTDTAAAYANSDSLAPAFSVLPRYDLVPISDELPSDGIIFAKTKSVPEMLVVFRTPEERLRNPERLNLDRRQLEVCPLLEQEQRLRLLNFQNNNIRSIQNLENLPNLIFLDLYNNKITSLEGPLSTVKGLRVLMAGKNKISSISNLQPLRKLDVLDLHSNEIRSIEGLDGLSDLRVLNLAGNRISVVNNLSSLASLTELNLRRNNIDSVTGLNQLPALQRVFLSHNSISRMDDIRCLFEINYLIELSLDGNPLSEGEPQRYRSQLVAGMPGLRHLDLKRVTEEERASAVALLGGEAAAQGKAGGAGGRPGASQAEYGSGPDGRNISGMTDHQQKQLLSDYDGADAGGKKGGAGCASDDEKDGSVEGGGVERSESRDDEQSRATAGGKGGAAERKGLQKYVNIPSDNAAGAAQDGTGDRRGFAGIAVAGSAYEGGAAQIPLQQQAGAAVPASKGGTGLAALARAGKLFNTQSIFDLEIIGPDEKALIAVGDNWEWTPTKRLLLNVTEASFYHMKRQTLVNKLGSNQFASLPALKCLRLVFNDFSTLKNVEFIPTLYGKQIEQLILRNCPLCTSASPELLRGYFTAAMPRLTAFNEVEITPQERQQAEALYGPMIRMLKLASPEAAQQQLQRLNNSNNNNNSNTTAASTGKLTKGPLSLLKAHQQQSSKSAASHHSGALFGLSAALSKDADQPQQPRLSHPPLLVTDSSCVGSRSGDVLRAAAAAGQAPTAANVTGPVEGAPLALSQRSLFRRSAHAQFAAAFDEAFKRIVFETISEIKHS